MIRASKLGGNVQIDPRVMAILIDLEQTHPGLDNELSQQRAATEFKYVAGGKLYAKARRKRKMFSVVRPPESEMKVVYWRVDEKLHWSFTDFEDPKTGNIWRKSVTTKTTWQWQNPQSGFDPETPPYFRVVGGDNIVVDERQIDDEGFAPVPDGYTPGNFGGIGVLVKT